MGLNGQLVRASRSPLSCWQPLARGRAAPADPRRRHGAARCCRGTGCHGEQLKPRGLPTPPQHASVTRWHRILEQKPRRVTAQSSVGTRCCPSGRAGLVRGQQCLQSHRRGSGCFGSHGKHVPPLPRTFYKGQSSLVGRLFTQRRMKPAEQAVSRGGRTDGAATAQEGAEELPKAEGGDKGRFHFCPKPVLVAVP